MDLASTIRKFMIENLLFEENENFEEHTSFLESGIIDSTSILELVMFIEETFGINVDDDELVPDNFDSIANIAEYIQRKQEQPTTAPKEDPKSLTPVE